VHGFCTRSVAGYLYWPIQHHTSATDADDNDDDADDDDDTFVFLFNWPCFPDVLKLMPIVPQRNL